MKRLRNREKGYVLLVILFLLAAFTIALLAHFENVATQIKRDREEEMVHRGQQYVRAIRRYYRKFGRYPSKIEDLESTNNVRYLRKRYKDPMVANGEWKILHYGEAKNPPRGLFGQPITAGGGIGGTTPGVNTVGGTPANTLGGGTAAGSSTGMSAGGPAASQPQSQDNGTSNTAVSGSPNASVPATGNQPTSSSTQVQTFGGGAIIGVESLSPKEGLKEIGGKNHYNEWEFVYDPRVEALAGAAGAQGNPNQLQQMQKNVQGFGTPITNPQTPQNPSPQNP